MSDEEIYNSDEYKARIERAEKSLNDVVNLNDGYEYAAIKTAAESIAYWQMRAVRAEWLLYEEGYGKFRNISNRNEI